MVWVLSVTVARELTNTSTDRLLVEIFHLARRFFLLRLNYFVTQKTRRSAYVCVGFLVGGLLVYCMLEEAGTVGTDRQETG